MRSPNLYANRPVYSLQTMLRHVSETDASILPLVPDGQYGSNTFASVLSFQRAYALPPTGIVDLSTWNSVTQAFERTKLQRKAPFIIPNHSTEDVISPGQFNYHIYLVQAMLVALSDYFPIYPPPDLTGTLDGLTLPWLHWIQTAAGKQKTSALNTETWNTLNALYRTVIGNGKK